MIREKWQILLSIVVVGLFCLVGCAGASPAQSPIQELDVLLLAEGVTEESDLLALTESATERSDLLALADSAMGEIVVPVLAGNVTEEQDPAILVHRRIQRLEMVLERLDRMIERGQVAEEEKAQILERVATRLETSLSDEEKAQILARVEAGIDRAIEQGKVAEQRKVQILDDVEARLEELVTQGLITTEQKDLILQRLMS